MKLKMFNAVVLAALLAIPTNADDAKPKKKGDRERQGANPAAQLLKQLDSVGLTDQQTAKIKEMGKKFDVQMKTLRDEAGITPELMKKRMEAQKSLKDSDKKGKERAAAINEAAGMTDAQVAAMEKMMAARQKLQQEVVGLLTAEQKENLPPRMTKGPKGQGEKGQGEKGKKANEGGKKKKKNAE